MPICNEEIGVTGKTPTRDGRCSADGAPTTPAAGAPAVNASPGNAVPAPPSYQEVTTLATQLAVELQLPKPVIHLGPDPAMNEWKQAFVGVPYWFWSDDPATKTVTLTRNGVTLTMTAQRGPLQITTGDGTTLSCPTTTVQTAANIGQPSPTCGHTYRQPSYPDAYTLTATRSWSVQWSGAGYSGTIPTSTTATQQQIVGELQSVRTK